ncbi:MAG: molybdate ABC transporter substrate-binding protein [Deltaproteobacteria bacterium]|nr:molybdate ABC transporter substrate-binding protein [Deltaproteobacteria bacterium]
MVAAPPRQLRRRNALQLLAASPLAALAALSACRRDGSDAGITLRIFAASSLRELFTSLAHDFEAQSPAGAPPRRVELQFAGSQVLRLQLEQGARADLFASADLGHAEALARAGLLEAPEVFATGELVAVVRSAARDPGYSAGLGPPGVIRRFEDLPRAERVVLAAASVPAGAYARRALAAMGPEFSAAVLARVASEEHNVRLVRAKVELGEADVGLVYRTDAVGHPGLRILPLPAALAADPALRVRYAIGRLRQAPAPALATTFLAGLQTPAARDALQRLGFGLPIRP